MSFQLAPKPLLISRIDYNPSAIWISPPKNSTYPLGKLRTKITSPITKFTSPGLLDTTFFACFRSLWPFLTWPSLLLISKVANGKKLNRDVCGQVSHYSERTTVIATGTELQPLGDHSLHPRHKHFPRKKKIPDEQFGQWYVKAYFITSPLFQDLLSC